MKIRYLAIAGLIGSGLLSQTVWAQQPKLDELIARELPQLVSTYKQLHAAPEISYKEEKTAAFVAKELRALGYTVTERVGKYEVEGLQCYGVVGVLKNGNGPTVLVRADMDGLPVEEKTNLPYASKMRMRDESNQEVPTMHACGHDVHVTCLLGTAKALMEMKSQWQGTVVLVGQPAEERGAGAKAMIADGLYTRFPRPDYAVALHDSASLPVGKLGYCPGYSMANVSSVNITVRGVGGHGAYPQTTKDPVVLAAQIVLALQTLVSRENSPLDPAVVTVGSIQGGTKHNIIPDEVRLQLTIRSYKEEVRQRILAGIERITKGVALAAGVPAERAPIVEELKYEFTPSTYNNPELTERLVKVWQQAFGPEQLVKLEPVMGGEDFGRYALDDLSIPSLIFSLGAVDPQKIADSQRQGTPLPSMHSSLFAPLPEPTLKMGVKSLTIAVLDLLRSK
jgi:amidohydrolase